MPHTCYYQFQSIRFTWTLSLTRRNSCSNIFRFAINSTHKWTLQLRFGHSNGPDLSIHIINVELLFSLHAQTCPTNFIWCYGFWLYYFSTLWNVCYPNVWIGRAIQATLDVAKCEFYCIQIRSTCLPLKDFSASMINHLKSATMKMSYIYRAHTRAAQVMCQLKL